MARTQLPLPRFLVNLARATRDPELRGLMIFIAMLLLVGTIFYANVEGWGLLDAFYYSAMLVTTIGSAQHEPVTELGKLFSIVYVFLGLGSVLGFVTLFSGHLHTRNK